MKGVQNNVTHPLAKRLPRMLAVLVLCVLPFACARHAEPPQPLRVILHDTESEPERLEAARQWLAGLGVDVAYTQADAKDIYNKTVLVVRTTDEESRRRLQDLTGIEVWIWARQERPNAPFEIIVGDDYETLSKAR